MMWRGGGVDDWCDMAGMTVSICWQCNNVGGGNGYDGGDSAMGYLSSGSESLCCVGHVAIA